MRLGISIASCSVVKNLRSLVVVFAIRVLNGYPVDVETLHCNVSTSTGKNAKISFHQRMDKTRVLGIYFVVISARDMKRINDDNRARSQGKPSCGTQSQTFPQANSVVSLGNQE